MNFLITLLLKEQVDLELFCLGTFCNMCKLVWHSKSKSVVSCCCNVYNIYIQSLSHSKEEGKNQESIQSSTTPDPGHHMEK